MKVLGAISVPQVVVPATVVATAGVALLLTVKILQEQPIGSRMSEPARAAPAASAAPKQALVTPPQRESALATAQQQAKDLTAALTPAPPPAAGDSVPEFDIVHIEPTGETVVAGRATPGATVELLRNGEPHDRVTVDQSGQFAMVPRPLPPGTYELTLRSTQPGGKQTNSKQSVAVVLEPTKDQPTVALMAPDKPTLVLSEPSAPASSAATTAVEAVDIEPNGKIHVSGRAHAGAVVRLYLNDSFVTSVTAGADGHLAVTINEGVAPGKYRVRLDELAANSASVRARAEVPLDVPDRTMTASIPATSAPPTPSQPATTHGPQLAAAASTVLPDKGAASAVVVPKITTMTVVRGDSLWRLSRQSLGSGERYALIYKANHKQIRNPNLIYPGQILVVPASETR
jgi:nucleoid-associated protein YgaU